MTIQQVKKEILEEFSIFKNWMDRYEHIIFLGKSIPLISDQNRLNENLIKGCQSKVWLHAEMNEKKIITFTADSNTVITKGIIAILLRVFNNQTADSILESDMDFIDTIGLKEHLSPTRANGLVSMIQHIKLYALSMQNRSNSLKKNE